MTDATTDDTTHPRESDRPRRDEQAADAPATDGGLQPHDVDTEASAADRAEDGSGRAEDVDFGSRPDPTAEADAGEAEAGEAAAVPARHVPAQYGIGPFSLREVILGAVWVVAFVLSFLSTVDFAFSSVWTQGIAWILPIGVPTVAVFLLALRRLSPSGIRRVGSLGIDQFASVAFSVSAVVWVSQVWSQVQSAATGGRWVLSWMPWAQLVLMLAGVVLTVFAPLVPGIGEDFRDRPTTLAHRNARPVRPVTPRPRPVRPARPVPAVRTAAPSPTPETEPAGVADVTSVFPVYDAFAPTDGSVPDGASPAPATEPDAADAHDAAEPAAAPVQAFWALVPDERDVVDEQGNTLFRIGPTAWALAIEDRGDALVIRHEDGRVGFLRDVSDVTRG